MSSRFILVAFVAAVSAAGAQAPAVGSRMPALKVENVAGTDTTVSFESGGAVLLGVTDRENRTKLSHWFRLLTPEASAGSVARYSLITLPSSIPSMFRGPIRSSFPKTSEITYLLDWGGKAAESIGAGDLPAVFVIAPGGTLRLVSHGEPDSARVAAARTAIDAAVASKK